MRALFRQLYIFPVMSIVLVILLCAAFADETGDTEYIDFSDDLRAYSRAVAELTGKSVVDTGQATLSPDDEPESGLICVLCRTTGGALTLPGEIRPVYCIAGPDNCYTLYYNSSDEACSAVEVLSGMPGIRYAELDYYVFTCGDETEFLSWGAESMNYSSYLDFSESYSEESAVVAVIDTGCFPHSYYSSKIISGGYDYIDQDDDPTNDLTGHGTAVAGVIADCTQGEDVYIYPIRALDKNNGKISNVTNAVREATAAGVDVINLSLTTYLLTQALDDAVLDAVSNGITVVCAAGNYGSDAADFCPAHIDETGVIVVGSSSANGERSSFSNYGDSVDVYCPGDTIKLCSLTGGYKTDSGTSFSAPHISAAAALLKSIHPELTPDAIESRIAGASQGDNDVIIPDLQLLIPEKYGFRLSALTLDAWDVITLPSIALPLTSSENITLHSSNEAVVSIEGTAILPVSCGSAVVTVSCTGLEDMVVNVTVDDAICSSLIMPSGLTVIEDEAFVNDTAAVHIVIPDGTQSIGSGVFSGCSLLRSVLIPASVEYIGENGFENVLIRCAADSYAEEYARDRGYDFLPMN